MANSVSKINIVVGASTGQLTAGMNQASMTVKSNMNKMQSAAQQATFAVDDFFAAFSTGGVAGGLRGAGNNLTMLAASLGGIKTQLAVIAGLAIGQLLIKQFSGAKTEAQELNEQLDKMSQHAKRMAGLQSIRRETVALQGDAAAFRNRPDPSRADFQSERERIDAAIKSATADAEKRRFESAQMRGDAIRQARFAIASSGGKVEADVAKRLQSQLAEAKQLESEAQMLENQAKNLQFQHEQLNEREKQLQASRFRREQALGDAGFGGFKPFINQQMRENTRNQLEQVTDELNAARAKFSVADVFRMLPGANALGSSGAVGSINAAMAGPQNARDAGVSLQRQSLTELKRIRELEEKKKGLLEVVGL